MTWNYRIIKYKKSFVIYEVYYEKGKIVGWTPHGLPSGETVSELMQDIDLMLQAQERPILKVVGDKLVKNDKSL
jgi:hypothetical protein